MASSGVQTEFGEEHLELTEDDFKLECPFR